MMTFMDQEAPNGYLGTLCRANAERAQFAMERRALHADETGGARDVAAEAHHLGLEVLALEHLAGLAQRQRHDLLPVLAGRSEEHTSELQPLMRISYAVFCLKTKISTTSDRHNMK